MGFIGATECKNCFRCRCMYFIGFDEFVDAVGAWNPQSGYYSDRLEKLILQLGNSLMNYRFIAVIEIIES